ncbi:MAG: c-type cytochrome [Shewanella sp.]
MMRFSVNRKSSRRVMSDVTRQCLGLALICLPLTVLAQEAMPKSDSQALQAQAAPSFQRYSHDSYNQALAKLSISVPAAIIEHQADAEQGAHIAMRQCIACHNQSMLTMATSYPSLYGQQPAYLVKQLLEFKSGQRANAIMQAQVMAITEADIKNIALWYSQQPILHLSN